ncbi:UvrD-helicase domain-containing protein [Candidatus Kuenenbacteria bacterium]|nr:UvrD-helicase domain-containing protein [Candidatus Kuenenbacteria bacterium]
MPENKEKIANLERLNPEQKEAVTYGDGPVLIVAGAGTGKTTVITERVAWLIEQGKAKAEEILALTFTDKAAGEMEERVDKALPYGYVDLWIMTFHAFAERILKAHALDIGVPNDFKLLTQTEQWLLIRNNLEKFNLDYYRPLGNPTKFIHALIKHFCRCKDEEIWPEDYLKYTDLLRVNLDGMEAGKIPSSKSKIQNKFQAPNPKFKKNQDSDGRGDDMIGEIDESEVKRLEEVANAYHVYQQLLLDNSALDFGDLINYTLKLFRTRPNILKKYQQQFKYILVDEFQDTNFAQYALVKLLAGEKRNLTVVGDDDQSVYKFRGASVSNILQFKDDYPESAEVFLNKNNRSKQNILDLAYNFIQLNNPERLEVKLKSQKSKVKTKELTKKLEAQIEGEGEIEYYRAEDEAGEVEWVVNKIIEIYNRERSKIDEPRGELGAADAGISWNDFVVLIRANNQAEAFINGLSMAGAPFNYVASKGLYGKEIIRDILAYLKLLDNYHETMAMWRILNLPMIKIKAEDLMEINRFANRKAYSIFEVLRQIDILSKVEAETKRKVKKILSLLEKHTALAKQKSVKEVILKFIEDFGYNDYLLKNERTKEFGYINSLLKKTEQFSRERGENSLTDFKQMIDWEMESGEQGDLSKDMEEGPEAVKIMTVHTAKGLEFKYVFVVNLADKRFPSMERKDPIELPDALVKEIIPGGDIHLQEERRLFYVAMTRAKEGLYLSNAENYGGKTKKKESRFVFETGLGERAKGKRQKAKISSEDEIQNPKSQSNPKSKIQNMSISYAPLAEKNKIELPKAFSYSQLKAFETCPYQYYLSFILKIPTPGNAMFSYGKTMHATLQRFLTGARELGGAAQAALFGGQEKEEKRIVSLEELLKIYREAWIDDWYESKWRKEEYRARGQKSLKKFYEQLGGQAPEVIELEKSFNLKIGLYTVRGVIDRIDRLSNGKVEIIDYKTGEAKSEASADKDQLLIYQLAAKEVFGWEVEKLTYYYLDNNTTVSFLGSEKELEKAKEKVLGLIEKIMKYDFTATPGQFVCQHCDFKEICEFREI